MNFTRIRAAQERLANAGSNPLGTVLWWALNGTRINQRDLAAVAERHGLDARYLPAELKTAQAFRRAWRHASTRLPSGLMLRPIGDNSEEISVGLVQEKADEVRKELDYDLVLRIAFDKKNSMIAGDVEHGVVEQVRELYDHHLNHTSEDVRLMMTAFLAEAGVTLRDAGGVYFVPEAKAVQLDALCRVVEEIGRNRTFRLPIVDTPATRILAPRSGRADSR